MLNSLRTRLILTHLGIVALALALLGLIVVRSLEGSFFDFLRNDLQEMVEIFTERLGPDLAAGQTEEIQLYLRDLDRVTPVRVRAIDTTGRLIGSTEPEDQSRIGQPLGEEGVASALRGERVSSTTVDRTSGRDVLYVAAPVYQGGRIVGAVRLAYQLVDIQAELNRRNVQAAVAVSLVAAAALGLALVLALTVAAPLRRLAEVAHAVAGGDFGQRAGLGGPTEFVEAGHAFDRMIERLGELEANRRALMGTVSHDLHTLATGLGAAAEALQRGAADDPELRALLLAGIAGHSRRLTRLADDLLQTARHEAGRLVVEPAPLEPEAVVRQVVAELAAIAGERGVRLEASVPEPLPEVVADGARLVQALGNLVENAIRHSPSGECVEISATVSGGWCKFTVGDRGPGLTPEEQLHVFEPMSSGNPRGRLGLGLSIVRAIAEAHGGCAGVESMGAGTTFVVVIPTTLTPSRPCPAAGGATPRALSKP